MTLQGRLIGFAFSFLLLVLHLAVPASAQHLFLDTNGDGVNDSNDAVDPSGVTRIDIWLDTNHDADGSQAFCNMDAATPLTINSWEVVLQAVGGTIEWGPLDNELPISSVSACFADEADTTDPVWYHNGWGGHYILDPGRYHVGTLRVRVLTGNPAIAVRSHDPAQPNDLTSFGTKCLATQGDNTYRLGEDWWDAAGLGDGLVADAGGPYTARRDLPLTFDSRQTMSVQGLPLTYEWDFGDGTQGTGPSPTHSYLRVGEYRVTLRVSDGNRSHETWTTVTVLDSMVPRADAGGPYTGVTGVPILLDGRDSSDPNGDRLLHLWTFGDGTSGADPYVFKTYFQAGTYTVTLTVLDGTGLSATDETTARIEQGPQRPPVAVAGGPYQGRAGVVLHFDGTGSSDPDGEPLRYRWIFGDGGEEGSVRSPSHVYLEPGVYEVVLEVTDGTFATSDVTTATIGEAPRINLPPTASVGGPYTGETRRSIVFQERGSSDPEGDPLTFLWNFGDQTTGEGPTASHVYYLPGHYGVILYVSDGTNTVEVRTTALVQPATSIHGRAFLLGGEDNLSDASVKSAMSVRLEPVEGSFRLDEIDKRRLVLRCEGSAVPEGVFPSAVNANGGDSDGNGEKEISAVFDGEDTARLLAHLSRTATARFTLTAPLLEGGETVAEWTARRTPGDGGFEAVVRPNPFNPQAVVTFVTKRAGTVRAQLYDTAGRLVRTLLRDQTMEAGRHDLPIVARNDSGSLLSSGVYFLRIEGPDGVLVTRVAVAK
ncbi:MAG TPA: PKD domain-containing protein [Candidatus Eisenbacteria bacterium]|nr:PKD domain-containing protein [Candidatus Eisenbacteria bacterium]